MKISPITKKDVEAVLQLNTDAVPHVNLIAEDELQWFTANAACAAIATIDDRFAGFMIGLRPGTRYASRNYRWFCDNYNDFAYIDRIVTAPWARRRGVAEALYRQFIDAESDAPVLTCEVNIRPSNDGSMQFHKRLGFRQVGSLQSEDGEKEVALMEKVIAND